MNYKLHPIDFNHKIIMVSLRDINTNLLFLLMLPRLTRI